MSGQSCEDIADRLVDYADGELTADESAGVVEHLARCAECRATLAALGRSLELAGVIWADQEAELDRIRVGAAARTRRFPWGKAIAAASILLVLGGVAIWRLADEPAGQPIDSEVLLAEIQREVMRAGEAAQLLAMAEYLAKQPGGAEYARERFNYVAANYPEVEAAAKARLRIQEL